MWSIKRLFVSSAACIAICMAGSAEANTRYHLIAKHSDKCINVAGGSVANKTPIVQWDCGGGTNDNFFLKDLGNGYHSISPEYAPNKSLDIDWNRRTENGLQLELYDYVGGDNQVFKLQSAGGGYYQIVSKASGKCLDVRKWDKNAGAAITQHDCKAGWDPTRDNQLFRLADVAPAPAPPPRVETPPSAPTAPVKKPQPEPKAVSLADTPLNSVVLDKDQIYPGDMAPKLVNNSGAALIGNTGAALIGGAGAGLSGYSAQSLGSRIDEAFSRAFGRAPTTKELEAWSQRRWLLTDEGFATLIRHPGADQLRASIAVAAQKAIRPGIALSKAEMDTWVGEIARNGWLYQEVVSQMLKKLEMPSAPSAPKGRKRPGNAVLG